MGSRMKIIYELIFLKENSVKLIIEANTQIECHMKVIRYANSHYPAWHGIREIKNTGKSK